MLQKKGTNKEIKNFLLTWTVLKDIFLIENRCS